MQLVCGGYVIMTFWQTVTTTTMPVVTQFITRPFHRFNQHFMGGPNFSGHFGGMRHNGFIDNCQFNNPGVNPPTRVTPGPHGNDNINLNPDQYRYVANADGKGGNDFINVNKSNGYNKNINVDGGRGFDTVQLQGEGLRLTNIGKSWDKKTNSWSKTYQFMDPRGNKINVRNAEQLRLDRNGDGQGTNLNLAALESQFYAARAGGQGSLSMDQFHMNQTGSYGS